MKIVEYIQIRLTYQTFTEVFDIEIDKSLTVRDFIHGWQPTPISEIWNINTYKYNPYVNGELVEEEEYILKDGDHLEYKLSKDWVKPPLPKTNKTVWQIVVDYFTKG